MNPMSLPAARRIVAIAWVAACIVITCAGLVHYMAHQRPSTFIGPSCNIVVREHNHAECAPAVCEDNRTGCTPVQPPRNDTVLVAIPYRDRAHQLPIVVARIEQLLVHQRVENYLIVVAEQAPGGDFNRGLMRNTAFAAGMATGIPFQCALFHDVDLWAANLDIPYTCPDAPIHLSVALDEDGFKVLPHLHDLVGGVLMLPIADVLHSNGYPNTFTGWGGEDDALGRRLVKINRKANQLPADLGQYITLKHIHEKPSKTRENSLATLTDNDGLTELSMRVHWTTKYRDAHLLHVVAIPGPAPATPRPVARP